MFLLLPAPNMTKEASCFKVEYDQIFDKCQCCSSEYPSYSLLMGPQPRY